MVRRSQPIQQVDPVTGEVVNVFSSPFHAERVLKIRGVARQIGAVCGPYVPPETLAVEAAARRRAVSGSTAKAGAAVARANVGGARGSPHQTAADLRRGKLVQGYRWRYHMPAGASSSTASAAIMRKAAGGRARKAGNGAGAGARANSTANGVFPTATAAGAVLPAPRGGGGLRTHILAPVESSKSAAASRAATKRRTSSSSSSSSSPSSATFSPLSSTATTAAFSSATDGGTVRGRRAMAPPAPSSGVVAQPTVGAGGTLQLYCLCKSHDGDGRTFVRCEACQDYFHPSCVGVTDEAVKIKKRFCCPDCRKSRRAKSRKSEWTPEEDALVHDLVKSVGTKSWAAVARSIPGRTGKQCRERWDNHLDPGISRDPWTAEEEKTLADAHVALDNKWAEIALCLPGRSEIAVKNYWNQTRRQATKSAPSSALHVQPASPAAALPEAVAMPIADERDAVALLLGLTRKSPSPLTSAASSPVAAARAPSPGAPVPAPASPTVITPTRGSRGPSPVSMPQALASSINLATPTLERTQLPTAQHSAAALLVNAASTTAAVAAAAPPPASVHAATTTPESDAESSLAQSASALAFAQAHAHAERANLTRALAEARVHFQMLAKAQAEAQERAEGLDEQSASVFQLAAAMQAQPPSLGDGAAAEIFAGPQAAIRSSSVISAADQFASTTAAVPSSATKRPFTEDSVGPRLEPGTKRSRSESSNMGGLMIVGNGDSTPMVSTSFGLDSATTGSPATGKQHTPPRMPTESSKKRLFPSPAAAPATIAT